MGYNSGHLPATIKPKYLPQLDGLRAFAILPVLLNHAGPSVSEFGLNEIAWRGWIGVDIFFVISGYLITGILLESRDKPHYYRNFYARRSLRIWPLYFAYLFLILFLMPRLLPNVNYGSHNPVWQYIFYVQNFVYIGNQFLSHTWSLAIEEQFYLVWPFIVRRFSRRRIVIACIAIVCLSPVLRYVADANEMSWYTIYCATPFRMDGLCLGALLALWQRSSSFNIALVRKYAPLVFLLAVSCAYFPLATAGEYGQQSAFVYTAVNLAATSLLACALCFRISLLYLAPLRYTGKISYGLYILHPLVFRATGHLLGTEVNGKIVLIAGFIAVFLVASTSWYLFEKPIMANKRYFENGETNQPLLVTAAQG